MSLLRILGYAALQGIFLPLILYVDDLKVVGGMAYLMAFGAYEVLVVLDTVLYWWIFKKEK